jgi:ligand-binding sensor domain-containing protein/two-component sensor histidine kinase
LGGGESSHILKNSYGIVPTGVPIPVTGKKMPFMEPHPVKATPMRYKDNATSSIQYLDVEQGLGYPFVNAICQDKKGIIWMGIDGIGLSKYDGITITTYTVKEGLAHDIIRSIIADKKDNLWIATLGGINFFNGKNFIQYTEKDGLPDNAVMSILEDSKGFIWISTTKGLTRFDGKYFTNYTIKEGLLTDGIYKCIEDRNGNIWIATSKGLSKFNGRVFTHYTINDGLPGSIVNNVLEDRNGNIWFSVTGYGICMLDGEKLTRFTKNEGLTDNLIWSMLEDRDGNIWIGTSAGGIIKYDGKQFTHYNVEQGLSNIKGRDMMADSAGSIWIATEGGGVNKINSRGFNYPVTEELVKNNRIRPILKDKEGDIWFGTDLGGVGRYYSESKEKSRQLFSYYKLQEWTIAKGQRSLLEDSEGNIWIGTTGAGLIKYNGKNFIVYSLDTGIAAQGIFDMIQDKKGNLWFGQSNGTINRFDGRNFYSYTIKGGLPGSIIYSLLEDRKGNIWFCTEGAGVYKFDGINLICYTEKEGLFSKGVTSIAEDRNGNMWLGTSGSGACMFDGKNFTYYSEQQGLANNHVWSVFQDTFGRVWMGTDKGLSLFVKRIDSLKNFKSRYIIYNFDSHDGLKAMDFNLHSVCVDNNNQVWWGTGKSVVSFDLNKEFHPGSVRSLGLNYLEINGRFYDYNNIPDSLHKKIRYHSVSPFTNYPVGLSLSHDQNHLSFYFSAIEWGAPEKIKYSYRMTGVDEQWSKPSPEPVADYRNLGYGKYEFRVKAIGESQVWTTQFSYGFTIRPAWWQTLWFRALVALGVFLLTFIIVRFIYLYRLRKQKALLEKQLAVQMERQRISTEMHDDIGAGLSGIRLMTEMAKLKSKDTEASGEIEKIYQSVGDVSSKMKEVIWSLNTENDTLGNLIGYLQKQSRQMMEHYPGKFQLTLPVSSPEIKISGEVRRHIYLAVKEALNNIIKHSRAGLVEMNIICNDQLTIIISDNGKGIPENENNSGGNGLRNMRMRMNKVGGEFFMKNENGVSLTFIIPLQTTL